ncbi:Cuticle protein 6, partial [Pseudolycoriella hygida]
AGQYTYGYNAGLSGKVETKSVDGITRGSYSYIDADGILQTVEYTADALNGFRAAATNLPRAPVDNSLAPEPVRETPEVAQARADFMAAYNEAASRASNDDTVETVAAPIIAPVQITAPAPIEPAVVALRAAPYPRASFAYQFSSPVYTYTNGNPFLSAPLQYTLGGPILRAAPLEIRPVAPILRVPAETPEVAMARAEHLAAVEKEKARIAASN